MWPEGDSNQRYCKKLGWKQHFLIKCIEFEYIHVHAMFFFSRPLFGSRTPVTFSIQVNMHGYFFFSIPSLTDPSSCRDAISARRATPLHLASQLQPDALTLTQCLLHFCHQQCHCTHPPSDLGRGIHSIDWQPDFSLFVYYYLSGDLLTGLIIVPLSFSA